jgi:hypothetical protein
MQVIKFLNENDEQPTYWYPLSCYDIKEGLF